VEVQIAQVPLLRLLIAKRSRDANLKKHAIRHG